MEYLHWKEESITDFSNETISKMYNNGFVLNRLGKGIMHQTRSVRIDLNKFEITSENRRILRKGENITLKESEIPYPNYSWEIGKLAKDFYDKKAGNAFSANKIKEIITTDQGFNTLLTFSDSIYILGYAVCYQNDTIIHYCYPFYNLEKSAKDMGLIMIIKTIIDAKNKGLQYLYLGSLQRPSDVYKLQFTGIEWFDGKEWNTDTEKVKMILNSLV